MGKLLLSYRYFIPILTIALIWTGNLGAQHVSGTKWMQRNTNHFLIIYPQTLSDDAAVLAGVIDGLYQAVSTDIPAKRRHKKWPLVLTDLNMQANGFVTLAPRRSVWYTLPAEDFMASSNWMMTLAWHEGLHLAQFDASDQGFTHFLRILLGDLGWGGGLVLGTPNWLLEGDAVLKETEQTGEGRGRDPEFQQEMAVLSTEKPDIGLHRAANYSYREYHPNHYKYGYELSSWITKTYGQEAKREIYRRTARIGLPVIGIDIGLMKSTGKHPREIFKEMIADISRRNIELKNTTQWTDARIITPPNKAFARYKTLYSDMVDGKEVVFVQQNSAMYPARLLRIDEDGTMKRLIRVPPLATVSMTRLPGSGPKPVYRVAWNVIRQHPVSQGVSKSDFTVTDIGFNGSIKKRWYPVKGSRMLYNSISPDGKTIAAVEFVRGSGSQIVVFDTTDGTRLRTLDLRLMSAAYPSWDRKGNNLVFSLRSNMGRSIGQWKRGSNDLEILLKPSFHTIKTPVYSRDGSQIFYSSNHDGMTAIRSLQIDGGKGRTIARRWYSATEPVVSVDGGSLYLTEYASMQGEQISRVGLQAVDDIEGTGGPVADKTDLDAGELNAKLWSQHEKAVQEGNDLHPESPYSPVSGGFNIHSWGLDISDFDPLVLRLNIRSKDILHTFNWEIGSLYDTNAHSVGAYTQLNFTGQRPIFRINTQYRYNDLRNRPYHDWTSSAGIYLPFNLAMSGLWANQLSFLLNGGLIWNQNLSFLPYVEVQMIWERLRHVSQRAVKNDLGWMFKGAYFFVPIPARYGDLISGDLTIYLPGLVRNTSLKLRGAVERRTIGFSSQVGSARAYVWRNLELTLLASAEYEFPLLYPDLPLGAFLFLQRFRISLFSDFAWIGNSDGLNDLDSLIPQWSSGAVLTIDFSAFNDFSGMNLGLQFGWQWETGQFAFDLLLKGLPTY